MEQRSVNTGSLLNIITRLRENLNLDESISSSLSAHTLEEFIVEKFPDFTFSNRTEEYSDDDVYIIASLLLFFICVNSKDIHIKSPMCRKLSLEDQEVILKFSKSLMECSSVTFENVNIAIIGNLFY